MKHKCNRPENASKDVGYGNAVEVCIEGDDGEFWAYNDEYATQVNYCPFCGDKAQKQIEI